MSVHAFLIESQLNVQHQAAFCGLAQPDSLSKAFDCQGGGGWRDGGGGWGPLSGLTPRCGKREGGGRECDLGRRGEEGRWGEVKECFKVFCL